MYKVTKMGLLNFWNYDSEEYEFFDGKLLLRGKNGSGKSVTMQSFIPLILDGNKTPKRLDTFGGSDKHIEYYILGEDKDASTAYLYMEFYNQEENKYITIGIGLSAKKGKPTDFYGFALKDGTRIHEEFELYKLKDGFSKTPLTKMELKSRLLPNNLFVETAKDYKKMVNDLLFGFKSLSSYDEFINIILQIRSPKLSKDYKPSLLMKTLNDVLPPLADEDLMPLSETIESLNSTKEQLEDLNTKIKELSNFIKVYNNYNEAILIGKIKNYLEQKQILDKIYKEEEQETKSIADLEENQKKWQEELTNLNLSYEQSLKEKESINNTDIEEKTKKVVILEQEIKTLEEKIETESHTLTSLNDKMIELKNKEKEYNEKIEMLEKELKNNLTDLEALTDSIHFEHLKNYLSLLIKNEKVEEKIIFDLIKGKKKEIERIKNILEEKEDYDKKIEEECIKADKLEQEYNKLTKELEEIDEQLEKEKDKFIDTLKMNNEQHTEFHLTDEELIELIHFLKEFSLESVHATKNKWEEFYQNFWQKKVEERVNLSNKLENFKEQREIEEQKLEELKNKKEVEIPHSILESDVLDFLNKEKIAYLPLYKAIDFKSGLKQEFMDSIEANLLSSGLLNAKIILEKDKKKLKNTNITYLVPSTKKKENLTKYLTITDNLEGFDKKYLTSILESISINSDDTIFLNEDAYAFEVLKGNNKNYESKYIGFLNREKEHKRKILEQENILKELNLKITSTENLIANIEEKLQKLEEEREDFPSQANLEELTKKQNHNNLSLQINVEEKTRVENNLNALNQSLKNLLLTLNELKKDNRIPLNLASFREAMAEITSIESAMVEVMGLISKKENYKDLGVSNALHLEDITFNYDNLFGEVSNKKEDCNKKEMEKKAIEEILNTKEYKSIASRLKALEEVINRYPKEKESYDRNLGSVGKEIETKKANMITLMEEKEHQSVLVELYYSILESEFNLGYAFKEETLTESNIPNLLKKLGNGEGRDKAVATANYYKGFNTYRNILMDYSPTDSMLFSENETNIKYYIEKGLSKEETTHAYEDAMRQDITVTYQSKKINLYSLLASIKDDYETNKIYLSEKDRHLFEDILLRTVGSKIKEKINSAKDWVKSINDMMEENQTKSNLRFHLSWLNKSKESLEEMDTKELVEIFKIDPDMLKKEDVERLIKHFRAKIDRAEETMADDKLSYFDVVSTILDYRNWFEFKLYYKRGLGDKKELTDKIFSVFSGGEKAKTMYVPLFASMAAKLEGASVYSPRLIALDEAFAGVDDVNIEEMFAILKSFNLDYILTSQVLWCDYKEVSDISICELVSDHLTNTIGVKRYRWNGKNKISLDD